MNEVNTQQFRALLRTVSVTDEARQMRADVQHGTVSTYDHCVRVAAVSYLLNRRLGLGADERSLVRGAFLHDFYLYDWHDPTQHARLHGLHHPALAAENAQRYYTLNDQERNIIRSHMWPLTITAVPACREAVIVCIADKWCSLVETLLCRKS